MAKFSHFWFLFGFGKILNILWESSYDIEQIFTKMAKYWANNLAIWSHWKYDWHWQIFTIILILYVMLGGNKSSDPKNFPYCMFLMIFWICWIYFMYCFSRQIFIRCWDRAPAWLQRKCLNCVPLDYSANQLPIVVIILSFFIHDNHSKKRFKTVDSCHCLVICLRYIFKKAIKPNDKWFSRYYKRSHISSTVGIYQVKSDTFARI